MKANTEMKVLAAAMLLALTPLAQAGDPTTASGSLDTHVKVLDNTGASRGEAQVAARIASSFGNFAGSDANALALANALRSGSPATLTYTTTTTGANGKPMSTTTTSTLTPPTKPMGWGNVKISLALAQAQLQQLGITKPTAEQLQAALSGGTVKAADGTSVALKGVLQMRADGMGWGQIAQAGGTKVGSVVSSLKQTQAKVAALPVKHDGSSPAATTTSAPGKSSNAGKPTGVVTATGGSASTSRGNPPKGLTTAGGTAAGSSSKGLVTAEGATVSHGGPKQTSSRGIVTAAGGSSGNSVAATSKPHGGASVVTGTGGGAGITTAHGSAAGNGNSNAGGNGKGKGG